MTKKDVFCFIPAKSASKRLKNKNIKDLNGKPMMQYAIEAAFGSDLFDKHVYLSTENNEFANIARNLGVIIPQLRPLELAFDPYGVKEVLLDFLETNSFTSEFENVIVISPTCPLLNSEDIENAYSKFKERNANILLSITETDHNSFRSLIVEEDYMVPLFEKDIHKKTQQLKTTYRINGAIIILNIDFFKKNQNFHSPIVDIYEMPRERSVDIDTIEDFHFAEFLINKK